MGRSRTGRALRGCSEAVRAGRAAERVDNYTIELHRHGLESVEREVRWLNELIATERAHSDTE